MRSLLFRNYIWSSQKTFLGSYSKPDNYRKVIGRADDVSVNLMEEVVGESVKTKCICIWSE